MSKKDNLKDFLDDLYEGIASKKPDASKNPQDFRAEIESISGGGGSGECSGNHIIEVDELPEVGEEGAIYRAGGEARDVLVCEDGEVTAFCKLYQQFGMTCEIYTVQTKPTENIQITDFANGTFYFYFVKDENDVFMYGDAMGTGTSEWVSFSILMGELPYHGEVSDVSQATENGYYVLSTTSLYQYLIGKGITSFDETATPIASYSGIYGTGAYPSNEELFELYGFEITPITYGVHQITALSCLFEVNGSLCFAYKNVTDGVENIYRSAVEQLQTYGCTKFEVLSINSTTIEEWLLLNSNLAEARGGWSKIIIPKNSLVVTANKSYDVSEYARLQVNVKFTEPVAYMVRSVGDLPTNANNNSLAIVMEGE